MCYLVLGIHPGTAQSLSQDGETDDNVESAFPVDNGM